MVDFLDQKIFGYAEVVFWNLENGRKFSYKKLMGPRRRFIPHNMLLGFCSTFKRNRYIRISWDRARNRFSAIFSMKGDEARPTVNAAFIAHYSEESMNETLTVVPAPTKRRCAATFFATPKIHGSLSVEENGVTLPSSMKDADGEALLSISRMYYAFERKQELATASGILEGDEKKRLSFTLTALPAGQVDANSLNPNFLFIDGKCTPLPPVVITHTKGLAKQWIIQDYENMVDLTFTPKGHHFRDISFVIMHSRTNTLYGTFEGVLKTKDGETIALHDFLGIVRSQSLRS